MRKQTTYLRRDGRNTIIGDITPDAAATRTLGSASLEFLRGRFRNIAPATSQTLRIENDTLQNCLAALRVGGLPQVTAEAAFMQQVGGGIDYETLAADKVLALDDAPIQLLDPGGANRNVDLQAEGQSMGRWCRILNRADAPENLVVRNDALATIATISQNEAAWFFCDGGTWRHSGIETIALS